MYGKGFLGNMTENLQADCVQSRQAGFMQCFLKEPLFPHFSRVFHSTFNNLWKTKTVVFCVSFRVYDKHCTIYGNPAPTPCAKLAGS